MKFYHKYEKALVAAGYTVDVSGYVWDAMGNQSAGEDNYGNVQSKDPNVTYICILHDAKPAAVVQPKKEPIIDPTLEVVRARTKGGHFIADDPSTPDVNEAWVVKNGTKKK